MSALKFRISKNVYKLELGGLNLDAAKWNVASAVDSVTQASDMGWHETMLREKERKGKNLRGSRRS